MDIALWLTPLIAFVGAVVIAIVVAWAAMLTFRAAGTRRPWAARFATRMRRPFRVALLLVALWVASAASLDRSIQPLKGVLEYLLMLGTIAAFGWLLAALLIQLVDLGLHRHPIDMPDNRAARRARTQILIVRRLIVVVVAVLTLGAILLTIPGVEAFGTSLLASAGLLSIVAGLAAQSSLANLFAGLQLAFSDAIRIDDVVVVEDEWGEIEEITLTYVVVRIWDQRRLVLPSTYFTTTPFQNWTRTSSELLGTVELDTDWTVDVDAARRELDAALADTDLWDGRVGIIQVTDAVGGVLRLRALVSATSGPRMFDLRCHVRERLVAFLQREAPTALAAQRIRVIEPAESEREPEVAAATADTAVSAGRSPRSRRSTG